MAGMSQPVGEFDIIGYADVLPPNIYPTKLPPIFEQRVNKEYFIVPPFRIEDGIIKFSHFISPHELSELVADERVTLIDPTYRGKEQHTLWLDNNHRVRYDPTEFVNQTLETFVTRKIKAARRLLNGADYDGAELLGLRAIPPERKIVEVAQLMLDIYTLKGNTKEIAFWKRSLEQRMQRVK